ncbi:hypothetical protein ACTXT7_003501 [Hymenolepis weldensis]
MMERNWPPRGRERRVVNALLTHSLRTPEFVGRDENRGKSIIDILPKIFKCLKEQQYIMTAPLLFPQGLGVNADADAYVETLQIIVVNLWIDSVFNGVRPPSVFQQDSAPFYKAVKTQDWMDGQELSPSCHTKLMVAS